VTLPDVNVLLYAFRSDSEDHAAYRSWLEGVLNGEAAYGMSPQVLASVIRIATHPRIYARPSRLADAMAFTAVLLEQPHCQIVQPGPRHWGIFARLCQSAKAYGNLVQDAWLAALAIESGCEWITNDRDYARFEGLRWRAPA
jgi:toxin-antitoxin system PIN domain toxin